MRVALGVIFVIGLALVTLALATALTVLLAATVAWALINLLHLPLSVFQGMALSLLATCLASWVAMRLIREVRESREWNEGELPEGADDESDEEDEWDEEDESDEERVEDGEKPAEEMRPVSTQPRWEPPTRRVEDQVPETDPDRRCPCGSGRKYKNCHGRRK